MNEKEIVKKINENPEALGKIIDIYNDKLLKYIMRITDVSIIDWESLLQDIFIKVYRNINEYDSKYSFSSWIYRIAHNMVIDSYRKNSKEPENISLDDDEYSNIINSLSDWKSPHKDLQKKDIKDCVQKSISSLSPSYREIVILRFIDSYSFEEISDILKIPVWTASTLINRAKIQLRENLEKLHCNN